MLAELSDPDFFSDFILSDTEGREIFSRYIDAMFRLPYALHHFVNAGQYFVSHYLRRLKKRNETHFAGAAYECTHNDSFLRIMDELPGSHIEPFASPQHRTTYMFANDPRNKKEVIFVSRMRFESYMAFLGFDLFHGMHHGHAPSQCRNCGKYFLTTNGHKPKYCNGISPQVMSLSWSQQRKTEHGGAGVQRSGRRSNRREMSSKNGRRKLRLKRYRRRVSARRRSRRKYGCP